MIEDGRSTRSSSAVIRIKVVCAVIIYAWNRKCACAFFVKFKRFGPFGYIYDINLWPDDEHEEDGSGSSFLAVIK